MKNIMGRRRSEIAVFEINQEIPTDSVPLIPAEISFMALISGETETIEAHKTLMECPAKE